MYKVLLADDEGITLDALKFILSRDFAGLCEIRTEKTGRGVIETSYSFRPDIAVVDIQMPGINGIEAIREVHGFCPDTKFIIISAYDRFTYAKEAIGLGVFDYLTKPIDRGVFVSVLRKAMREVDRAASERTISLRNREKLETVVPILENGLIFAFLNESPAGNVAQFMQLLDIAEPYGYMMLIAYGDLPESAEKSGLVNEIGSGIRMQRENLIAQIRSAVRDFNSRAILSMPMGNRIIAYVPTDREFLSYEDRVDLVDRARSLADRLTEKTSAEFRIGIGTVQPTADMKRSYSEALSALNQRADTVSHAADLPVRCSYEANYPVALEKELFSSIQGGSSARAEKCANQYFDWMISCHPDMDSSIRVKCLDYVLLGEHWAYASGALGEYRFGDRAGYLGAVNTYTYPELRDWFVRHILAAADAIHDKAQNQADSVVDQAKVYIGENYQKDIALDDVSREVNISPYYFSKLFKEQEGVGFVEYLTNLRMEKARELLRESDMPVRDICTAVGYSDPNYFSRIFKKTNGVTPTEYKEGKRA